MIHGSIIVQSGNGQDIDQEQRTTDGPRDETKIMARKGRKEEVRTGEEAVE